MLRHQAAVDKLNAELNNLHAEAKALESQRAELEKALAEQEQRLAAEGGGYAARRPALQEQLKIVEEDIKSANEELYEMSAHLLPFALAPELCQSLSRRLTEEAELSRLQVNHEFWQERMGEIQSALCRDDVWKDLKITPDARRKLIRRITNLLKKRSPTGFGDRPIIIHHLAEPERQQLQEWIAQALYTVPQQVKSIGDRLKKLQTERRRIEKELEQAPDDEMLAPIRAEMAKLEAALTDVGHHQAVLDDQIKKLEFQRGEQARRLQRAADEFILAQKHERQLALAEQSKLALRAFEDALTRQKIEALEKALVEAFNTICRKEHLLEAININPDNFYITLFGAHDRAMNLDEFSAGERQLYALSLLWALRKVSGRQLPLVVDTPLARLDEFHRWRLFRQYIPAVSNQVVLFVTGAELDTELLAQAEPYLARVYRLEYDSKNEATVVMFDSQPVAQGIVLYRGETPGAMGFDIHGGYDQTWTTDFEHAKVYGEVKKALLPKSAKRLVLVDPETDEYNWEHIAELERITNDRYIAKQLRKKDQIYDLWQEEWTQRLQHAGYDSIATVSIEGPEEYVLNPSKLIPLNGEPVNKEEGLHGIQSRLRK